MCRKCATQKQLCAAVLSWPYCQVCQRGAGGQQQADHWLPNSRGLLPHPQGLWGRHVSTPPDLLCQPALHPHVRTLHTRPFSFSDTYTLVAAASGRMPGHMSVLSVHDKERTALHRIYYSVVSTIDAQQLIQGSTSGCVCLPGLSLHMSLRSQACFVSFMQVSSRLYPGLCVSPLAILHWKPLGSLRQQQQLLRL